MLRGILVIVGLFALFNACTQRLICPAYQSSFIYDQETLKKKFSYFKEDSTPKVLTASKSKYLIAVPESYAKKYRKMQTVEMKPVYPVIPDSLKSKDDDDFSLAESDVTDSTAVLDSAAQAKTKIEPGDSTYAITKTKEKYNLDQDLYMWYFRDVLVLPDVRAAMEKKDDKKDGGSDATAKKEKVGFFDKLKNIFKKKDKSDSLSTKQEKTDVSPEKKKGGLFGKKKKEEPQVKPEDPKKKDDGF